MNLIIIQIYITFNLYKEGFTDLNDDFNLLNDVFNTIE